MPGARLPTAARMADFEEVEGVQEHADIGTAIAEPIEHRQAVLVASHSLAVE